MTLIAISGASGLIGRALAARCRRERHDVLTLVRREARGPREIPWDPARGEMDPTRLEGADVVVHLSGENIGQRWTRERKERIRGSRVRSTEFLGRTPAEPVA